MARLRAPLLAVLLSVFLAVSPAAAHFTEWVTTGEAFYLGGPFTTLTTGDTIRARFSSLWWDSTRAANMRHQATHGYRFTADTHDESTHLSATRRFETTIPAPFFDRDLSATRCTEAEITSESSTFPTANVNYTMNVYYMRWFYVNGVWLWDPSSGVVGFSEQLSAQLGGDDKWQVISTYSPSSRNNLRVGGDTYGTKAAPANPPTGSLGACQNDGGPLFAESAPPAPSALAQGYEETVVDEGKTHVVAPDLSAGLDAYAADSRALGEALTKSSPASGVATFARPLSGRELQELEALGLEIHAVEAVSDLTPSGLRLTYGNTYGPHVWAEMDSAAAEEGTSMLGIVAADVTVPAGGYSALASHDSVFLIDLAPEQVRRNVGEAVDVHLNDLYWQLAGWDSHD